MCFVKGAYAFTWGIPQFVRKKVEAADGCVWKVFREVEVSRDIDLPWIVVRISRASGPLQDHE
jgi:hypothetical protein